MPQASDELRAKMNDYFGDPIDDSGPINYLLKRGFIFTQQGIILPPTPYKEWCDWEADCIDFLADEWDYGYEPSGSLGEKT